MTLFTALMRKVAPASFTIASLATGAVAAFSGCARDREEQAGPHSASANHAAIEPGVPVKTPEQVQSEHEAAWMALPHVIGTGIGEHDGRPCLVVFASAPHEAHAAIPTHMEGYAVRVEVVGEVKAGEGEP